MYFVFNLNETISYGNHVMSINSQYMYDYLKDKEHDLIFVASNGIRNMLPHIDRRFHNETLIGLDGAVICKNGQLQQTASFKTDDLIQMMTIVDAHHGTILAEGVWDYTYTGGVYSEHYGKVDLSKLAENKQLEQVGDISKLTILNADRVGNLIERMLSEFPHIPMQFEKDGTITLKPANCTIWDTLQTLNIQKNEYVAIGFNESNQEILQHTNYNSLKEYSAELAEKIQQHFPKA